MPEFYINLEWEESPRVRARELSATWARLEIYAEAVAITKVEDHRTKGFVRNGIYVPLYPIAEWFVSNWWFLWHEWRRDRPIARHNLLAAREGFALPDLNFLPTESLIELVWRSRQATEFDRVSFLSDGSRVFLKDVVQEQVRSFVTAVCQRLDDQEITETFLAKEWKAILEIESVPEQRKFCEQAAHLGIDPFDPAGSIAGSLEELDDLLPRTVIDDFCDAVRINDIPFGVRAVTGFLALRDGTAGGSTRWEDLSKRLAISNGHTPWQYGYKQAQHLRTVLGMSGPIDDDLVSVLRELLDTFEVHPFDAPVGIEAIAAQGENQIPSFGISKRAARDQSRRFLLCRALSDFLTIGKPSLVTNSQTEHQQRNRAFAAEFLAPAQEIRDRLSGDSLSEDDLEDLANEFRVSGFVIRHQVENHRLARVIS
jgi:hypothetical protein